ncbi:MAG: hypothetical protein SVV80_01965 [Planctomycetota bacterium]|nr:hypothetical protein [Planctomycetota bacterium]
MKNTSIFHRILGLFVAGIISAAVLWIIAWLFLPDVSGKNQITYTPEEIEAAEKARNVSFDPNNLPVLHVKVDYSEWKKAGWYPKGESPILANLVKEGKLPPVAERVGPEPCVMKGCDGIGKYGGTWLRVASNPGDDIGIITWRMSAATAMVASGLPNSPPRNQGTEYFKRQTRIYSCASQGSKVVRRTSAYR